MWRPKKKQEKKRDKKKKNGARNDFPFAVGKRRPPAALQSQGQKKKNSKNKTKKLGKTRYRLVLPDCLVFAVFLFIYFFFKWELDSEIGSCKDSSTMQKKKKLGLIELKLMVCRRVWTSLSGLVFF